MDCLSQNYNDGAEGNQGYFGDGAEGNQGYFDDGAEGNQGYFGDGAEGNQGYFDESFLYDALDEKKLGLTDRSNSQGEEKPIIKKGKWKSEEDARLNQLVEKHGDQWTAIATEFQTRSNKQCRERWIYHLSPDVETSKWTVAEEKLFIDAHRELGNKWSKIAERMPGRTDNAIKNYFNQTKRSNYTIRKRVKRKTLIEEYIANISRPPPRRRTSRKATQSKKKQPVARKSRTNAGANRRSSTTINPILGSSNPNLTCIPSSSTFTEDILPGSSNPNPNPILNDHIQAPSFIDGSVNNMINPYSNELACVVKGYVGTSSTDNNAPNPSNATQNAMVANDNFMGSENYENSTGFMQGYGYEDPCRDEIAFLIAGFNLGSPQHMNEWDSWMDKTDKKGKAKMPGYL